VTAQPTKPEQVRVVIVEDEALIAAEIEDRLTRLGYQILAIADTGEKALAAAAEFQPDLVLMDIRIKGSMDGIAAAEEIQKVIRTAVVFLTAHSDAGTLQRAKSAAPYGYVLKPFREQDLVVALEIALTKSRLERRLRDSEEKYATTLASIADGVIATDVNGRVTFMNPVAEALTQWSAADAIGIDVELVLPVTSESNQKNTENPAKKALGIGQPVYPDEPCVVRTRTGETIAFDGSAAPIRNSNGKINGAVVAFRDAQPRRLAEEALRMAEEQLRQAHKMEAVGRLAGGISHDFNNLLMVINGYAELLLKDAGLDEVRTRRLTEIRNAGARASSLTKQLLAFSRKQALKPEVVNLNSLIEDVENLLRRLIGENIVFTTTLSQGLWPVSVDPGQFEQIVMNLCINARDAMAAGGRLTLETRNIGLTEAAAANRPEGMNSGRFVGIVVSDSGSGIDPSSLEHLFEPFFTTKEIGKGTGLGLSTVYGIVKQSGGFISVDSEPGRGSVFQVYLPVAEGAFPSVTVDREREPIARGRETVLVVEDDEAVRNFNADALREYGYQVITACSGEEALAIIRQHALRIQIMITDVIMPGIGGKELARRARSLRPEIQVVYLSGYGDGAIALQCELEGASYLQKPSSTEALAQQIRQVLDRNIARQARA
jgi:two-component system cell cycle sensor histidine kinase/response regulator CckA